MIEVSWSRNGPAGLLDRRTGCVLDLRDRAASVWEHRRVDTFFKISERGSTIGREIRGGVVTFFTMAYIVVLNPLILGFAKDADGKYLGGGATPNLAAIAAATALVAGIMTILMG